MSKFRKFLEATSTDWKPNSSSHRTIGYDPSMGQVDKIPVGGFKGLNHYTQWHNQKNRVERNFDLEKLANAMGVDPAPAAAFNQKYPNALNYENAIFLLRDLQQKTIVAQMYLSGADGATTDPTVTPKLRGAHFQGQDPNTGQPTQGQINYNIIQNLDKKFYTLEGGKGGGVESLEIGMALSVIKPTQSSNANGTQRRIDVNVPLIEKAVVEFGKIESDFSRGLAYKTLGAGLATGVAKKGYDQMMAPTTGGGLGYNPFAPAKS
jgi:hypothetical protein